VTLLDRSTYDVLLSSDAMELVNKWIIMHAAGDGMVTVSVTPDLLFTTWP